MRFGRAVMGALYLGAGVGHFVFPRLYASIVPDYLPAHHELVAISGAAEIAAGVGLLLRPSRRVAAWGVIALLIAVSPANLWMVQHPERYPNVPLWALWLRLPLQLLLLWWAWRYTRADDLAQVISIADSTESQ